ncbi:hypothetical protein ACQPZF_13860 [Actinosynnema sp. CS-041913]|uniref:hypothetical protein n=1 Tax=Actinosynnema sp. CS-041913 TaxID=3239917 RepID=UPI003D926B07
MTAVLACDPVDEACGSGSSPSFPEEEFEALIQGMIVDNAPRLFAVVQEYGERVDARVGAWGLAFSEHAEVVSTDGTFRMGVQSADDALRWFETAGVTARVVWAPVAGVASVEVTQ